MRKPKMMFKLQPKQQARNVYQLYIYDAISKNGKFDWNSWTVLESETSAKYFQKQLETISSDATIELYINSNGGDAIEGTAIYNQLVRHPAHKIGYVDGVAYSAAFLILMACNHIVMGLGTTALVHNMWMEACGNSTELRKAADDLDRMMESNRKIFLNRSNLSEEELINLMEEERILTPDECMEYGFCDEVSQKTGNMADSEEGESEEETEDNPGEGESEEETEDNPGEGESGEEELDDDLPDDEPDDLDDDDMTGASQLKQLKAYAEQRRRVLQQIKQLEESARKSAYPGKPVQNKCINFFDNF